MNRDDASIRLGDCLSIFADLEDDSADLAILDPPYCSQNKARTGTRYSQEKLQLTRFDDMSERAYRTFMSDRLAVIFDKLKPSSHLYAFVGWKLIRELMDLVEASSFRLNKVLVWDLCSIGGGYAWRNQHEFVVFASKGVAKPVNDKSLSTMLSFPRIKAGRHPFEKPVPLLRTIVRNASQPGDLILDGFAGSGSTGVAALLEGRKAAMAEISEKYVALAERRLDAAVNGQDDRAIRLGTKPPHGVAAGRRARKPATT